MSIQKLKVIKTLGEPIFRTFESRYSVGTMPTELFYKHTIFCAEHQGDVVEIVAYRLSEEEKNTFENQLILQD